MNMKEMIDKRLSALGANAVFISPAKIKRKHIRSIAIAAAVFLFILVAVPVMGSTIPGVNYLISAVSAETAQMLAPIRLVYEDQDIEVKVRAAIADKYISTVYMSIRNDHTGKDNYLMDWSDFFNKYYGSGTQKNDTEIMRLIGTEEDLRGKKITMHIAPEKSKWQITVMMEPPAETLDSFCRLTIGEMGFDHVYISPIGITFSGMGGLDEPPAELTVIMEDGGKQTCEMVSFKIDGPKPWRYRVSYSPVEGPLDISRIQDVQADGQSVYITRLTK